MTPANSTTQSLTRTRRPGERPPVRRRHRGLRWTSSVLTALIALALVSDRIAVNVSEGRIADRLAQRRVQLGPEPEVTIDAFPYLLDAAAGNVPRVHITADGVESTQGLPVDAAIDLNDLTEHGDAYTARSAQADLTIPFTALQATLGPDIRMSGSEDRLLITRSIFGMPLTISADVALTGDVLTVRPTTASLGDRRVDPATAPALSKAFEEKKHDLPKLPLGLTAESVSVGDTGLTLHARAERITLT